MYGDRASERFPVFDDFDKPTDEPTNPPTHPLPPAIGSPPRIDEWKEVGAATLGLIQRTLVAFWDRLRPLLEGLVSQIETVFTKRANDEKPVSSGVVPPIDESNKPTAEPFPMVNQWTETGKTLFNLTKRPADTFVNQPTSNQDAKSEFSRQAVDVGDDKPPEPETQPVVSAEWQEAGKTLFELVRQLVVASWSRLRPTLQDLLAKAETAFAKVRTNCGKPDIAPQINGKPEGQGNSESQNQRASLLANAALFTGIPSLFLCCGPAGIVAIVLGILALGNAQRDSKLTNQRAVLGMASGVVSSVRSLGLMLLVLATGTAKNATVSDWGLAKGRPTTCNCAISAKDLEDMLETRPVNDTVDEVGVRCPKCGVYTHSHYLSTDLEQEQDALQQDYSKKRLRTYQDNVDRLQKEFGK